MSEDEAKVTVKSEVRRGIIILVTAAIIGLTGAFMQNIVFQASMQEQIEILRKEQDLIRTKLDLINIQLQRKVNRETMDNNFGDMTGRLERIEANILEIYKTVKR